MSQEHDSITTTTTIRKQRRTRQRRNQPVLVTDTEIENTLPPTDKLTTEQEAEASNTDESAPERKAQPLSRLPKFFSRVDKSEQKEDEVVKARLARANHDKVNGGGSQASTVKANTKNDAKLQSKTPERREPLFKIRHVVGMVIYLFGAQLVLPYEFAIARQLGLDHPYPVTVFNFTIPLSSGLFLNIATLILFLYILVKLDLLPNTASAKIRAEQKAKEQQSKNGQDAAPAVKNVPPPMKLGVKGQDDDLYKAYRANQRREKKR
ncbi:MAG TPA: hypothetical protein VN207_06440 [Ktedonobacteraceae bacterium]|nr:hypothetical protein [Ktedonobacteraceae bacterium]